MTSIQYDQTVKALFELSYAAETLNHKNSYLTIIDALANFYAKALFQADR